MALNPGWNPDQYLRFSGERLQPAIDLVRRIEHPGALNVVDLGCGTGSALPLLAARFPEAEVTGVDGSAEMLAKAAAGGFAVTRADIASWAPEKPVDVLFSNAALHWLPEHEVLFPRLLKSLAPGGTLAVQMPAMHDAPLRALQLQVAAMAPWGEQLAGIGSAPPILSPGGYYDLLRPLCGKLEIWVTEYVHVLSGPDPVVQWAMGSSLRPWLDALSPEHQPDFLAAYAKLLRPHYPEQADGKTLLPFRRIFLLASL